MLPVEEDRDGDGKSHFHKLYQGFMQISTCSLVGSRLGIKAIKKKTSSYLTFKCFVIKHLPFVVGCTCFDYCFVQAKACCWPHCNLLRMEMAVRERKGMLRKNCSSSF